jgi:hypothetical protein
MFQRQCIPNGGKLSPISRNQSPTVSAASTDTETSLMLPYRSGIMRVSDDNSRCESIRVDRAGTIILPGSKSHRVSFADEVRDSPRPIAKVHHIESFKHWNMGNRFDTQPGCVCTIS